MCAFEPGANGRAARVVFDEELATLRESSRAVKIAFRTLTAYVGFQRNKFCTINNLPSEILREILLSACESGLRSGDLASILKTCKSWYNVLGHDPVAYSTINLGDNGGSHRLAKIFARKSVPLPLSIGWADTGTGTSPSNWSGSFCSKYISRIKILEYYQSSLSTDQWILNASAPQLERCELFSNVRDKNKGKVAGRDTSDGDNYGYSPKDHVLPWLFGRDTPMLRILDLRGVRLAWRSGNYRNLTHLTIAFHPTLVAHSTLDDDDITIVFQDSPNLARIELTSVDGYHQWADMPHINHSRPRCIMRRLRTLRLRLPAQQILSILRAIELTPAIETVDIYYLDKVCLEILDVDVLPAFLFTNLRSSSLFSTFDAMQTGWKGTGLSDNLAYSIILHLPFENPLSIVEKLSERRMSNLKHLTLPAHLMVALVDLLSTSPTISHVDLRLYGLLTAKDFDEILSDPRNHAPLSRVLHWALVPSSTRYSKAVLLQTSLEALKSLFRLSSGPKTLSLTGCATIYADLRAMREFAVDLAQLGVTIENSAPFSLNDDGTADVIHCTSVQALWPDDEVPEVVRGMTSGRCTIVRCLRWD